MGGFWREGNIHAFRGRAFFFFDRPSFPPLRPCLDGRGQLFRGTQIAGRNRNELVLGLIPTSQDDACVSLILFISLTCSESVPFVTHGRKSTVFPRENNQALEPALNKQTLNSLCFTESERTGLHVTWCAGTFNNHRRFYCDGGTIKANHMIS